MCRNDDREVIPPPLKLTLTIHTTLNQILSFTMSNQNGLYNPMASFDGQRQSSEVL